MTSQAPTGFQLGAYQSPTSNFNTNIGSNQSPNILGMGTYNPQGFNIDPNQFNNPLGNTAPALQNAYQNYLGSTTAPVQQQVSAATAAPQYAQGINGQLGLANTYQNMAAGQGPSLAAQTAQQQGQTALAGNLAMLGSARGAGDPAAAQLAARNAQANTGQQIAQNATLGRTNEELGALSAAGGLYGNVAGQGLQSQQIGQANNQFNAGQGNQLGVSNQANNLAAQSNYLNSLSGQNQLQAQGQQAAQQLGSQNQLGLDQIQNNAYQNSAANTQKVAGAALQGVTGLASFI